MSASASSTSALIFSDMAASTVDALLSKCNSKHIKDCPCTSRALERKIFDEEITRVASGFKKDDISLLYIGAGEMRQVISTTVSLLKIGKKKIHWTIIEPNLFLKPPAEWDPKHVNPKGEELLAEVSTVLKALQKEHDASITMSRFTTLFSHYLNLKNDKEAILNNNLLFQEEFLKFSRTYRASTPSHYYGGSYLQAACLYDQIEQPAKLPIDMIVTIDLQPESSVDGDIHVHCVTSAMRTNQILGYEEKKDWTDKNLYPYPKIVCHYGSTSNCRGRNFRMDPSVFKRYLERDDKEKMSVNVIAHMNNKAIQDIEISQLDNKQLKIMKSAGIEACDAESPLPGGYVLKKETEAKLNANKLSTT